MSPSAEPSTPRAIVSQPHLIPAHLLMPEEIVILILKPSGWFVPMVSLPVLLTALVVATVGSGVVFSFQFYVGGQAVLSLAMTVGLARLMVACWQWLGRTYVLTNLRIMSIRGVMDAQVRALPLMDVGRCELVTTMAERMVDNATLYCAGKDKSPTVTWDSIDRPREILEIVRTAISDAQRNLPRHE